MTNRILPSDTGLTISILEPLADDGNIRFCQPGLPVLATSNRFPQISPVGMPCILRARNPLKILKSIVGFDSVDMVCLVPFGAGTNERFKNEPIDGTGFLFWCINHDVKIASPLDTTFQNPPPSRPASFSQSHNPPLVRDGIRPITYRLPSFSHVPSTGPADKNSVGG